MSKITARHMNITDIYNKMIIELGFKGLVEVKTSPKHPNKAKVECLTLVANKVGVKVQTRLISQTRRKYGYIARPIQYIEHGLVYFIKN